MCNDGGLWQSDGTAQKHRPMNLARISRISRIACISSYLAKEMEKTNKRRTSDWVVLNKAQEKFRNEGGERVREGGGTGTGAGARAGE